MSNKHKKLYMVTFTEDQFDCMTMNLIHTATSITAINTDKKTLKVIKNRYGKCTAQTHSAILEYEGVCVSIIPEDLEGQL